MNLVWVHEDAITLDHPVMEAAGDDANPIFIWDTKRHDNLDYSLKRRMFIYECALDLSIPIYADDPLTVLSSLSSGDEVYTAASVDPYVQNIIGNLRKLSKVVVVEAPIFADVPANVDTARFFRFWNQAKRSALTHSQNTDFKDGQTS